MASRVVLCDFANGNLQLTAGTLIDDTRPDMVQLRAAGLVDMPAAPSVSLEAVVQSTIEKYRGVRASGVPQREDDLIAMLLRSNAGASMVLSTNGQTVEQRLGGGGGGGPGPWDAVVYVDITRGNDATGVRGDANLPYQTIQAALAARQAGDTLLLGPGDHAPATLNGALNGLAIIGMGSAVTRIVSNTATPALAMSAGQVIDSITLADINISNTSNGNALSLAGTTNTVFLQGVQTDATAPALAAAVANADVLYIDSTSLILTHVAFAQNGIVLFEGYATGDVQLSFNLATSPWPRGEFRAAPGSKVNQLIITGEPEITFEPGSMAYDISGTLTYGTQQPVLRMYGGITGFINIDVDTTLGASEIRVGTTALANLTVNITAGATRQPVIGFATTIGEVQSNGLGLADFDLTSSVPGPNYTQSIAVGCTLFIDRPGYSNSAYVDTSFGQDATGRLGMHSRPFKTITAALAALHATGLKAPSVVELIGGNISETVVNPTGLVDVTFRGRGQDATTWRSTPGAVPYTGAERASFEDLRIIGSNAPSMVVTGTILIQAGLRFRNVDLSATGLASATFTRCDIVFESTTMSGLFSYIDCASVGYLNHGNNLNSTHTVTCPATQTTVFAESGHLGTVVLADSVIFTMTGNASADSINALATNSAAFIQITGEVFSNALFSCEGALSLNAATIHGSLVLAGPTVPASVSARGATILGAIVVGDDVTLDMRGATFDPASTTLSALGAISSGYSSLSQGAGSAWVDPVNGNDRSGQLGNPLAPFRTIQAALNAVPTNSTVYAAAGTYTEDVVWPQTDRVALVSLGGTSGGSVLIHSSAGTALTMSGINILSAYLTGITVRGDGLGLPALLVTNDAGSQNQITFDDCFFWHLDDLTGGLAFSFDYAGDIYMTNCRYRGSFLVKDTDSVFAWNLEANATTRALIPVYVGTLNYSTSPQIRDGYEFHSCKLGAITILNAPSVTLDAATTFWAFDATGIADVAAVRPDLHVQGTAFFTLEVTVTASSGGVYDFDGVTTSAAVTINGGNAADVVTMRNAKVQTTLALQGSANLDVTGVGTLDIAYTGTGTAKRDFVTFDTTAGASVTTVAISPPFPAGTVYTVQMTPKSLQASPWFWDNPTAADFDVTAATAGDFSVTITPISY